MDYFLEARDPESGATVLVVCRTRAEAVATIAKFTQDGLENVRVTDRYGSIIPKLDLSSDE